MVFIINNFCFGYDFFIGIKVYINIDKSIVSFCKIIKKGFLKGYCVFLYNIYYIFIFVVIKSLIII